MNHTIGLNDSKDLRDNPGPPPIGLLPRSIAKDARRSEVAAAIMRYLEVGYPIPHEWVDEYNELGANP